MLITNKPSDELHIYNNNGEEIVTIDGTGVTKPEIGGGCGGVEVFKNLEVTYSGGDYIITVKDQLFDTIAEARAYRANLVDKFLYFTLVGGPLDDMTLYLAPAGINVWTQMFQLFGSAILASVQFDYVAADDKYKVGGTIVQVNL